VFGKIAGGVLLVIGVALAFKMLIGIAAAVLSVVIVAVLIYAGWRLLSR